jgi:hypothetical protein
MRTESWMQVVQSVRAGMDGKSAPRSETRRGRSSRREGVKREAQGARIDEAALEERSLFVRGASGRTLDSVAQQAAAFRGHRSQACRPDARQRPNGGWPRVERSTMSVPGRFCASFPTCRWDERSTDRQGAARAADGSGQSAPTGSGACRCVGRVPHREWRLRVQGGTWKAGMRTRLLVRYAGRPAGSPAPIPAAVSQGRRFTAR